MEQVQQQSMDFIYHDFDSRCGRRGSRIANNTMRLHWKENNKSICLNKEASDIIRERGLLNVRVREDRYTGEIVLIFNKTRGIRINDKRAEDKSITINSVDITSLIETKCSGRKPKVDERFSRDYEIKKLYDSQDEVVFDIIESHKVNNN